MTSTGITSFNIVNGTYNISIVADGFAFDSDLITIATDQLTFQYYFSLFLTNSFNISFYDEITKTLLDNRSITFELISTLFSNNYTTTNGSLEINLVVPEQYTIQYFE